MPPTPKIRPRKYSWRYDNMRKQWRCKETDEVVTDIMIADVDGNYESLNAIPESFHIQLRMLLAKRNMNGCRHPNKLEVTMFGDAKPHYTCSDCGWSTPRTPSKELPAIDDLTDWVAQQEGVVASWKAEEKVNAEKSKQMNDETDALIAEVFNAKT